MSLGRTEVVTAGRVSKPDVFLWLNLKFWNLKSEIWHLKPKRNKFWKCGVMWVQFRGHSNSISNFCSSITVCNWGELTLTIRFGVSNFRLSRRWAAQNWWQQADFQNLMCFLAESEILNLKSEIWHLKPKRNKFWKCGVTRVQYRGYSNWISNFGSSISFCNWGELTLTVRFGVSNFRLSCRWAAQNWWQQAEFQNLMCFCGWICNFESEIWNLTSEAKTQQILEMRCHQGAISRLQQLDIEFWQLHYIL